MKIFFSVFTILVFSANSLFSQTGASFSSPYIIYPATTCSNTCGLQYCGNMECPTGGCLSEYITMSGSSGGLNPVCTSDNESTQHVMWMKVYATATNFTINNGSPYTGGSPAATAANTKDYVVYSGATFATLSQIACVTLAPNTSSTITGLTAGQIYYIMGSPASTNTTADAISVCITSTVGYHATETSCATAQSISTNSSTTYTNAGATAVGPICSGSVENDTWYQWCAPSNWPAGQQGYVSVNNQVCNYSGGLQLSVWNTNTTCPTSSANATVVCQNPGALTTYYYQWTAVANQCYYITIDGYAGAACQFTLAVGSVVVLPIELVNFDAKSNGHEINLNWTTASEINNDYFTVEKSNDAFSFSSLARVEGAGNSSSVLNYSYTDLHPYSGVNYYRLKQTDYDGHYSYSDVVAVNFNNRQKFYSAYNSTTQELNIAYYSAGKCVNKITLYDLNGRRVFDLEKESEAGQNNYFIPAAFLSKGMYFLTLENDQETMQTKLIKD
jgi:hypothetical protein